MNFDAINEAMHDCKVCKAQVKASNFSSHLQWHATDQAIHEQFLAAIKTITDILGQ